MDKVKFTVLGEPKGKGRPRFSTQTGRAFTPKQTVNYETLVHTEYMVQCKGFRFPDEERMVVRLRVNSYIPKSGSKKEKAKKLENIIRPTKKPDMDNVVKMVADALNQVAYKDDTQIVDCQVRKFYSEQPRIEVIIQEVGGKE